MGDEPLDVGAGGMDAGAINAINAASLKLPNFWIKKPLLWFARAEAQFHLRGITSDRTKFDHVMQALDDAALDRVEDLVIADPLPNDAYTQLRLRLTGVFDLSNEERARRLLDGVSLGDRKPSALLAELRGLVGARDMEFLLTEMVIRALPSSIATTCRASNAASLEEMCAEADRHFAFSGMPLGAAVNAVSASTTEDFAAPQQVHVAENPPGDVSVNAVWRPGRRGPLPAGPHAWRPPVAPGGHCYYHQRFGAGATKCRRPCTFATPSPPPPQAPPRRRRQGNGAAGGGL